MAVVLGNALVLFMTVVAKTAVLLSTVILQNAIVNRKWAFGDGFEIFGMV